MPRRPFRQLSQQGVIRETMIREGGVGFFEIEKENNQRGNTKARRVNMPPAEHDRRQYRQGDCGRRERREILKEAWPHLAMLAEKILGAHAPPIGHQDHPFRQETACIEADDACGEGGDEDVKHGGPLWVFYTFNLDIFIRV